MKKTSQALNKIKVTSTKVTENGEIIVNLPNKETQSEVEESLVSTFLTLFA